MPGRSSSPDRFHGFLVVDKPAGWTSHDVVARVRRLLGERRVGHAGTLDPAATGVLPIAVGAATRVLEFMDGASKTYIAAITFGVTTDSYDADGVVTKVRDSSKVDEAGLSVVIQSFLGPQRQVPPMHSAIRIGGRRLYEEARAGKTVERPARPVVFHRLDVLAWDPPTLTVLVHCSAGTYVRSLAHDMGVALGVGAHLSDLVRLQAGVFTLCQAWTLGNLEELDLPSAWPDVAFHPDVVLEGWPALLLEGNGATNWRQGKPLSSDQPAPRCRTYDETGAWLGVGIGNADDGTWRPTKVIMEAW